REGASQFLAGCRAAACRHAATRWYARRRAPAVQVCGDFLSLKSCTADCADDAVNKQGNHTKHPRPLSAVKWVGSRLGCGCAAVGNVRATGVSFAGGFSATRLRAL